MSRQSKAALLAMSVVAAFVGSLALHSVVASVIVLLSGITISYVLGIAWLRTNTHRVRGKQRSAP